MVSFDNLDIVSMYKKGFSIDYIVNTVFKNKLQASHGFIKVGNLIIVKNDRPKKKDVRREVEEVIISLK